MPIISKLFLARVIPWLTMDPDFFSKRTCTKPSSDLRELLNDANQMQCIFQARDLLTRENESKDSNLHYYSGDLHSLVQCFPSKLPSQVQKLIDNAINDSQVNKLLRFALSEEKNLCLFYIDESKNDKKSSLSKVNYGMGVINDDFREVVSKCPEFPECPQNGYFMFFGDSYLTRNLNYGKTFFRHEAGHIALSALQCQDNKILKAYRSKGHNKLPALANRIADYAVMRFQLGIKCFPAAIDYYNYGLSVSNKLVWNYWEKSSMLYPSSLISPYAGNYISFVMPFEHYDNEKFDVDLIRNIFNRPYTKYLGKHFNKIREIIHNVAEKQIINGEWREPDNFRAIEIGLEVKFKEIETQIIRDYD